MNGSSSSVQSLKRLRGLEVNYYERMEAAVADLRDFFGGGAEQLVTRTLEVNVADLLMVQRALEFLLPEWRVCGERRYDNEEEVMVKRLAVKTAPDQHDFVIRQGRQFWVGASGERLVVDIWASNDRRVEESEMTFTIPAGKHEWLLALLPQLKTWSDANHFLRGKSITAEGKFLRLEQGTSWDDIVLPEAVRETIQRNCIDLLGYSDLYRANGIPLKRGLVLHGPPGTGKTMIGRALAQRCGVTFILCTPGMLEDAEDVARVFDWGRRFAPSILFFEDFDLVAGSRHEGGSSREILGEFLTGLDGLDSNNGVITIATTNDLKAIEPALKDRPNRFDCVVEIPPMGEAQREQFLVKWQERHVKRAGTVSTAVGDLFDTGKLARRTAGFTGAQMQELCRLAVFEAVEESIGRGRTEAEMLPLTDAHFERAMGRLGFKRRRAMGFTSEDE